MCVWYAGKTALYGIYSACGISLQINITVHLVLGICGNKVISIVQKRGIYVEVSKEHNNIFGFTLVCSLSDG